jgi:hypothetical protein
MLHDAVTHAYRRIGAVNDWKVSQHGGARIIQFCALKLPLGSSFG